MEQPLYQLISLAADAGGLEELLQTWQSQVLLFLSLLALLCCFLGFFLYRAISSALVFLAMILVSFRLAAPAWGTLPALTLCTVAGVCLAFLAFRFYRLDVVALSALITAAWVLQLSRALAWSQTLTLVLLVVLALAAGLVSFHFPVWGISAFLAAWGGVTLAMEGFRLLPFLPEGLSPLSIALGVVLAAAGFALQLVLTRKQTIFPRIMPKKLEFRLEQRKMAQQKAGHTS